MAVHLIFQVNNGQRILWAAVHDGGQLAMQSLTMWLERNGLPTTRESIEKYHVEYCPVLNWPPTQSCSGFKLYNMDMAEELQRKLLAK